MKKILLILLLFGSFFASAQIYNGYTNINARYQWEGGIFKGLRLPAGDSAQFRSGQLPAEGSIYVDTVSTPASPEGVYIYIDGVWQRIGLPVVDCNNKLLTEWSVSWQGTGFNFSIHGGLTDGQGSYQIGCAIYQADSITVTNDPSDDDKERIDVFYLDATGVHILKGDTAAVGTALKPQVEADQIELSFVTIAPGSTEPTLTQLIVYDVNTESVVTNTGTTTDPNNATNVFRPTLSVNVTNINNGDVIFFTKAPSLSTWNVLGFDALSFAIKLKATLVPAANIGVQLFVGTTAVSTEVIIPLAKTNITTYQQISIPLAAFGNITNTSITRVRYRYIRTGNNTNYTGFYLDYIYFVDGITQPTAQPASFTINLTGHTPVTQQSPGVFNLSPTPGTGTDYYTRAGTWSPFPTFVDTVSTIDGRSRVADGGVVDGRELFLQTVNGDGNPGLMTSAMFLKLDSTYYITNLGDGDSLAMPVNAFTVGIKSIKLGTVWGNTDSTILIDTTGGSGSASRFGVPGEDDTGIFGVNRSYTFADDESTFEIKGENVAGFTSEWIRIPSTSILDIGSTDGSSTRGIAFTQGNINVYNLTDPGATTYKIAVIDSTTQSMYWISQSVLGGGGGSSFLPVTGTGTATGNITGDLDGNILSIEEGGLYWLLLNPTAGSEQASLRAFNTTGSGNQGVLGLNATNTLAVATLTSDFDGASQLSRIELATDATTSTATYTAVQHTVAGLVRLNTLGGSGTRVVLTDNDGDLSGSGLGTGVATWWATPSSANLLAAITDETGTGLAVFGNTPTITTPVFSGAVSTTAINQLGTNASGTGYIPYVQSIIVRSDETLSNSSADQNLFTNTSHDVITVQANTTYEFYLTGDLTHGAVSHSIALGFTPTTATVTSIEYNAYAWVTAVGTATASQVSGRFKVTATSVINLAGANAVETFEARGTITIGNTGGTITPQIKFSADPTGTILLKAGARMHIWPIGNDTFIVQGNIN